MDSGHAELSSVATALGDLTKRITSLADEFAARKREGDAADLYAVERALTGALRRLGRVLDSR